MFAGPSLAAKDVPEASNKVSTYCDHDNELQQSQKESPIEIHCASAINSAKYNKKYPYKHVVLSGYQLIKLMCTK